MNEPEPGEPKKDKNERENENQDFGKHKDVKGDENSADDTVRYHPQCVIPEGEEQPVYEENTNKVKLSKTIEGSHAAMSEYRVKRHEDADDEKTD